MNDNVTITLTGDKDIIAALKDFRDYLPNTAVRQALRKGALLIQGYVALVAPKLTGKLARNIVVRVSNRGGWGRAKVTVNTQGKANDPQNSFYWRFLEEGFHTKKGEFRKYPFIKGVWDQKNQEAVQLVFDAIDQSLDRAEKKAKRAL